LRAGDVLAIGAETGEMSTVDPIEMPTSTTLRIRRGPRDDWFTHAAWELLCGRPYTVSVRSNRVGARLDGAPLDRANLAELPSEGVVLGAVQVTADGQPLVFLADHPTTGGYPVIGVVDIADVPILAQTRPGTSVMFHGSQR
jgi:allophanate hydrolase subunit 2